MRALPSAACWSGYVSIIVRTCAPAGVAVSAVGAEPADADAPADLPRERVVAERLDAARELPFHQLEGLAGARDLHRARRVAHPGHYCGLCVEAHLGRNGRRLEEGGGV